MAVNVEPKPIAAFGLSVVAGLIAMIGPFLLTSFPLMLLTDPAMASMVQVLGVVAGLLTIVGGWLLYNSAAQRKIGSTLVLVFSLISMNILGLVLGVISGFLGLTYKAPSSNTSGRSYNPP